MDSADKTTQSPTPHVGEEGKTRATGQPRAEADDKTGAQHKTHAAHGAGRARLVCLKGLVMGQEFHIGDDPVIIGRKEGVTIVLDDGLVSRRHTEIAYEDGSFVIRDLGSRNGTKVNGRRIREKILRAGDRVAVGRTTFRFLLGEGRPSMTSALGRLLDAARGRPLIPVLIFLIAALAALAYLYPGVRHESQGQEEPQAQRVENTSIHRAEEALKSENFSIAREILYQILAARPNDAEAQVLLKRATEEEASLRAIKDSEARSAEGKMQNALEALRRVSEGSVYYARAQDQMKGLRHKFVEPLLEEAKGYLKEKKWDRAREKLENVLENDPDNIVAIVLLDLLNSWEGTGKRKQAPKEKKSEAPPAAPATEAMTLYLQGDLDGAISSWERHSAEKEAREKLVLATALKRHLALADIVARKGDADAAIVSLTKALVFHERISGGKGGPTGTRISSSLADTLSSKGEGDMKNGRYAEAFVSFTKALEAEGGDIRAREGMTQLGQKAEDLFRQAYVLEKVNPTEALNKWKQIVLMVPPNNEYYAKSRDKIASYKK